jgi:hypothetical protein
MPLTIHGKRILFLEMGINKAFEAPAQAEIPMPVPPETRLPLPRATGHFHAGAPLRIGLIVMLALALRLFALGWGIPTASHDCFHPDEPAGIRAMIQLWNDPRHLSVSRYASTKGMGCFYTGMAAMMLGNYLGWLGPDNNSPVGPEEMRRVFLTLRAITVLFSLGTVYLVFLVGRRLFGAAIGELAAVLEAVSPISVINAHFINTDCPEAFWITLTLYLVSRSVSNRRWLAAAMFTAGAAGAFKYPGISAALLVPAAAWLLTPDDRARRLGLCLYSIPLLAAGFVLFCPGALLEHGKFLQGLTGEAEGKLAAGSALALAGRALLYPFRLMAGVGIALPLGALAGVIYSLFRRRGESTLLLAWLLPYAALMSGSAVVLVRYAVPMMPVAALLISRAALEGGRGRKSMRRLVRVGAGVFTSAALIVTLIHLRTMSRPDPRELAGQWISSHIPSGKTIAVTPSHNGDQFFIVPVDPAAYRVIYLNLEPQADAANYMELPFDYLAINEKALVNTLPRHPSQIIFQRRLDDPERFHLLARFSNRPRWPGMLLKGDLPEDLYYLYQETRIYQRLKKKK